MLIFRQAGTKDIPGFPNSFGQFLQETLQPTNGSSRHWSRFFEFGRPAVRNIECAAALLQVRDHCLSSTISTIPRLLLSRLICQCSRVPALRPMRRHGVSKIRSRQTDSGRQRGRKPTVLRGHLAHIKRILHEQENVNVVRLGFGRNERAENDKMHQMARGTSQLENPL